MGGKMEGIDVDQVLKEMENVPFGNSHFQNSFFTDGQEAPERRYRHVLLQLNKKIQALKACEFRRQRLDLDLEELDEKIDGLKLTELPGTDITRSRRRLEIDKAEKEWGLKSELQLIKDAMVEVETYLKMLQGLPKPTRQEFEQGELKYWRQRLEGDARRELVEKSTVGVGTLKALEQIGIVPEGRNDKGQLVLNDAGYKTMEDQNDVLCKLPPPTLS